MEALELGRQAQETRNERVITMLRGAALGLLLVLHLGTQAPGWSGPRTPWPALVWLALANLTTPALWWYLRRDPAYHPMRKYVIGEMELLMLTVGLALMRDSMPPFVLATVPHSNYMLLLLLCGLRYSTGLVIVLGFQCLLLDLALFAGPTPLPLRVPAVLGGASLLAFTSSTVAFIVSSLLALHREAFLRTRASEQKSLFLATVSHELRTPLTSILGYSQMLRDGLRGPLNAGQTEAVDIVHRNATSLLSMIEELLEVNRIEAGQVRLKKEEIVLQDCAARAYQTVAPQLEEKGLDGALELGSEPVWVMGDFERLYQVLVNLLANATKFTPRGRVELRVQAAGDWAEVRVVDTGPGIPLESQARIFEPFYRADASHPGWGLGLPICRKLLGLHGGSLAVQSQPGRGATFLCRLPRLTVSREDPRLEEARRGIAGPSAVDSD